jgi:hypothetical protein
MVNMMEWQKQQIQNGNVDAIYVKVMTNEQLETLRKQIAIYATIEMKKPTTEKKQSRFSKN